MQQSDWIEYEGVVVRHLGRDGAYGYRTSHIALDADGSPRAYHPDDIGLDANANAGYPHKGWRSVLAVDPHGPSRPYVQTNGRFAGYFVSKTSLRSHETPDTDPAAYVDAETIPYVVFPGAFYAISGTGRYGDLVMARAVGTDRKSWAIVADGGPAKAPLGEISLTLATALGGHNPNPRNGAGVPHGSFEYVVFPGSAAQPSWPGDPAALEKRAQALLAGLGGWPD